ncbi:endothelin-1 isoform X2 [Brachyhypopomus gauderio]
MDIIWVNTPSKTAVYGLGSPLVRRLRSANRCFCANSADQACYSFCVNSSEKAAGVQKNQFEPVEDKPETRTSDLQSVRLGVAPAVVAGGTEIRACADILTFLRNMIRARAMKRASAPTQMDSRVLILGYS